MFLESDLNDLIVAVILMIVVPYLTFLIQESVRKKKELITSEDGFIVSLEEYRSHTNYEESMKYTAMYMKMFFRLFFIGTFVSANEIVSRFILGEMSWVSISITSIIEVLIILKMVHLYYQVDSSQQFEEGYFILSSSEFSKDGKYVINPKGFLHEAEDIPQMEEYASRIKDKISKKEEKLQQARLHENKKKEEKLCASIMSLNAKLEKIIDNIESSRELIKSYISNNPSVALYPILERNQFHPRYESESDEVPAQVVPSHTSPIFTMEKSLHIHTPHHITVLQRIIKDENLESLHTQAQVLLDEYEASKKQKKLDSRLEDAKIDLALAEQLIRGNKAPSVSQEDMTDEISCNLVEALPNYK